MAESIARENADLKLILKICASAMDHRFSKS